MRRNRSAREKKKKGVGAGAGNWPQLSDQMVEGVVNEFYKLPHDGEGRVIVDDICQTVDFALSPFSERLVSMASASGGQRVSFTELVKATSYIDSDATVANKLRMAFDLYNLSGRQKLSGIDIFCLFRLINGKRYSDDSLQRMVNAFVKRYPQGIGEKEFSQLIVFSDLSKLASR